VGIGSKDRLAFGLAAESLLSPTIRGGEAALPLHHFPLEKAIKTVLLERLRVNFFVHIDSHTNYTVESVDMGTQQWDLSSGRNEYSYPPTDQYPPSPHVMVLPPEPA
jgi:hypothetical protein